MQYLLLITEPGFTTLPEAPPEVMEKELKAWSDYTAWLQEKGWMVGGEALQPTSTATTVRQQDGKILTTDGPFAETKEALSGYYLIECENLDQAIEAASKIPSVSRGPVEVRPVMKFS
jgi:hypothetical protein